LSALHSACHMSNMYNTKKEKKVKLKRITHLKKMFCFII
jgi:hypothetical protein